MRNFKKETITKLELNGKTIEDIRWIGCDKFKIPIDLFWKLADFLYDNGYGAEGVASDLLIVGDDWFMERNSYDGAEWWEFKTMPEEPKTTKEVPTLFPSLEKDKYIYLLSDYE